MVLNFLILSYVFLICQLPKHENSAQVLCETLLKILIKFQDFLGKVL